MSLRLTPTLAAAIAAASRPLAGMWVCSGSPLVAEICAGSGIDWVLIDGEHSPVSLETTLALLQAVAAYPATPLVRVAANDPVLIKQVLDLGAQNLLVPIVSSADEAADAVRAVRYPPHGVRGVGSALARSARWNRVDDYLRDADSHVALFVQIENVAAVEAAADILAVDGIAGVFIGPSDLAASMGLLGQQTHPDVVAAAELVIDLGVAAGKPVGVNAFDEQTARRYADRGASFIAVGADVAVLARGSEALAGRFSTHRDVSTGY